MLSFRFGPDVRRYQRTPRLCSWDRAATSTQIMALVKIPGVP
jgi:hypothetical protein